MNERSVIMEWKLVGQVMPKNRQGYLVANKNGQGYDIDYTIYKEETQEYYRGHTKARYENIEYVAEVLEPPGHGWVEVKDDGEKPNKDERVMIANKRYKSEIYDRDIVTYRKDSVYTGFYRGDGIPAYKNIRFWARIPVVPCFENSNEEKDNNGSSRSISQEV